MRKTILRAIERVIKSIWNCYFKICFLDFCIKPKCLLIRSRHSGAISVLLRNLAKFSDRLSCCSTYCQNALSFSKKCTFLGFVVPAGLLIPWFCFPNHCSSSLIILSSAGCTKCCWKSSVLWRAMCWPVFLVNRYTEPRWQSPNFLLQCFFSAEGNELFAAINSSVLPMLKATIHALNHCLHYFYINPLSNTLLIQWHAVNQIHTIITALRLYWSSSNILFKGTDFMASFRVNLQHETQRLSHRIKFYMQRSLMALSSQTHTGGSL